MVSLSVTETKYGEKISKEDSKEKHPSKYSANLWPYCKSHTFCKNCILVKTTRWAEMGKAWKAVKAFDI